MQIPFESRYVIFVHISQTQVFSQVSLRFNSKQEIHLVFKVVPVVAKRNRFLFWAVPRGAERGGSWVTARGPGRPDHVNYFTIHYLLSVRRCTSK